MTEDQPETLGEFIAVAVSVVEHALTIGDLHTKNVERRKEDGLRTVPIQDDVLDETHEAVYDRCAYWEDFAGEGRPRENSLEGISTFEQSYRKLKRRHVSLSRTTLKLTQRTVKQLLRSPVVSVEPEIAVAILGWLEEDFLASQGHSGNIADYTWNRDTLTTVVTNLHNDVESACWKPPRPITFAFYEGLVLSDLEVIWRMLLSRGKYMDRSRVVWGYHLEPDQCMEFGGDFSEGKSREEMHYFKGQWMPDSYFYSYFLAALYDLSLVFPLKHLETQTGTYKAATHTRDHYHLDVSVEDAMDFLKRIDLGEDDMKKNTVYDNIPCLDLEMGAGHPKVVITCKKCQGSASRAITKVGVAPHVFLKQWGRDGWDIRGDGRKAICPDCVSGKKEPKKEERQPEPVTVAPVVPLHQRQNAARMVLGRTNLSPEGRKAAEQRCRELGLSEEVIIRISLKAQGLNSDGTDMETHTSDGKRRTFSFDFKREFVRRAMRLDQTSRRRLLDANDIHPGMFRRWRKELHDADNATDDEPEISESLIDGMIDQGVKLAERVEAQLDSGEEFSDDFKLEVVGTCAELDDEDRTSYLQSLDITDGMYEAWLKQIEPEDSQEIHVEATNGRQRTVISENPVRVVVEHEQDVPQEASIDPQVMFTLFGLFEKGIDKKRKQYQKGWSDERVAEEAGVDVSVVLRVREQTIGKIITPQMVEETKARMAALTKKYEEERAAVMQMAQNLENKYDDEMKALRAEIGQ